ncbi:NlpC/P60 family protein [Paenibacillus silvisoli]|uniref:NlpC/P60 family protein n=1 Tax=Paenibacillus silvisoli TaxID=3110539 RepID=UPI0028048951|nr:NlpC/P60 family protein [Paenibacillus silvisoli]
MPTSRKKAIRIKKAREKALKLALSHKGKLLYIYGEKEIHLGYGDCSGFCRHVYRKAFNIDIGDTTSAQVKQGMKVPNDDANEGDIIFFKNIGRKGVSHAGIVTKPGRFIGLQINGCRERNYLRGFWKTKFMQIRSVIGLPRREKEMLKKAAAKQEASNEERVVHVYAVTTTGNEMKDALVKKDLTQASEIWKSSGISFRLKSITRHTDEAFRFKNGEFIGGLLLNKQPKKVQKLIRYSPKGSTRRDVVVIYLTSKAFKDVGANRTTTGAIYFFGKKIGPRVATILLAANSKERAQMLAHELGHALFVNPLTGKAVNPSRTLNPKEPSHDTDKRNLMYPKPPANPVIKKSQREKARQSILVREVKQAK